MHFSRFLLAITTALLIWSPARALSTIDIYTGEQVFKDALKSQGYVPAIQEFLGLTPSNDYPQSWTAGSGYATNSPMTIRDLQFLGLTSYKGGPLVPYTEEYIINTGGYGTQVCDSNESVVLCGNVEGYITPPSHTHFMGVRVGQDSTQAPYDIYAEVELVDGTKRQGKVFRTGTNFGFIGFICTQEIKRIHLTHPGADFQYLSISRVIYDNHLVIWNSGNRQFEALVKRNSGAWGTNNGMPGADSNILLSPSARTLFLVHGVASDAVGAWALRAELMKTRGGYDQVIAVSYHWQDDIPTSASSIASWVSPLGIRAMDVEAHSLGAPVAMLAICEAPLRSILVKNFISMAGAYMGTPVADDRTVIIAKFLLGPTVGKALATLRSPSLTQLTTSSAELLHIRDSFDKYRPSTWFIAVAGSVPNMINDTPDRADWPGVTAKLIASPTADFDGIIPTHQELGYAYSSIPGKDGPRWTHGSMFIALPAFPFGHVYIHDDSRVIQAVSNAIVK